MQPRNSLNHQHHMYLKSIRLIFSLFPLIIHDSHPNTDHNWEYQDFYYNFPDQSKSKWYVELSDNFV